MEIESSKYTISESEPLILIISGLSGSGKDTVINRLKEISTVRYHFVVTCNTRKKREGEIDGKDYHFISRERFLEMIKNGEMLEHSEVYDDLKGVPRFEIEKAIEKGEDMILRLDYQGMKKVKAVYPDAVSIFIIPPNADAWLARLRARNTDSEGSLQLRIRTAVKELEHINDFDYILVNDEIDHAAMDLLTIMRAEHMRSNKRRVSLVANDPDQEKSHE
ncbi:MAG: guanylate kinase [Anaerolineaceae bacterium]|nr:guanylate kinase [Anaerolineaceae bacterium]